MLEYHTKLNCFPDCLKKQLPKASSTVSSDLAGWVLNGETAQAVFWEIGKSFSVPAHAHDHEEWGIVITGYCILTIAGETKQYNAGEEFYVPASVSHSCYMSDGYRSVDFFASPDWVKIEK